MDENRFREMLLAISDKLSEENIDKLKFLCPDIGRKRLEKVKTGIELFECLIERAKIRPDNTDLLRNLLNDIGQKVLIDIIDHFERYSTGSPADGVLDAKEREKIDAATDVIAEQLGRRWVSVGRKLGLTPTQLESIQEKHRGNLEEQVREMVVQWMRNRKAQAQVEELIKALRDCNQNLTADLVKKKLQENA